MSDPLAERLSRLTPDAGALNRDALLFAAGRASARASRSWRAVAGTLAACQILTLMVLWPHSPDQRVAMPRGEQKSVPAPTLDRSHWPAPRTLAAVDEDNWKRPADSGPFIPDEPVLHAFGTLPADLLN